MRSVRCCHACGACHRRLLPADAPHSTAERKQRCTHSAALASREIRWIPCRRGPVRCGVQWQGWAFERALCDAVVTFANAGGASVRWRVEPPGSLFPYRGMPRGIPRCPRTGAHARTHTHSHSHARTRTYERMDTRTSHRKLCCCVHARGTHWDETAQIAVLWHRCLAQISDALAVAAAAAMGPPATACSDRRMPTAWLHCIGVCRRRGCTASAYADGLPPRSSGTASRVCIEPSSWCLGWDMHNERVVGAQVRAVRVRVRVCEGFPFRTDRL